tara:strand:+ start:1461 stop:2708 length:1248 start_codon:yes stop_codon:yes gene_type:complete
MEDKNSQDNLFSSFTNSQREILKKISLISDDLNVSFYLVGGTVRDLYLKRSPEDLDILVADWNTDFLKVAQVLNGEIVKKSQFNTVKIQSSFGEIDFTTFRKEKYDFPAALPIVSKGTIEDDLSRRDFTINAMAIPLSNKIDGELIDPFNGLQDLSNGFLRVLHSKSFIDDPTRILRGIRYKCRFEFEWEPNTKRLLNDSKEYIKHLSGDRIRNELVRIFSETLVSNMLSELNVLEIWESCDPNISFQDYSFSDLSKFLDSGDYSKEDRNLILVALLASLLISQSQRETFKSILNMDKAWIKMTDSVGILFDLSSNDLLNNYKLLVSKIKNLPIEAIDVFSFVYKNTKFSELLRKYMREKESYSPILTGNDLIAIGVPKGHLVGKLLDAIFQLRVEGDIVTKEDEIEFVCEKIKS